MKHSLIALLIIISACTKEPNMPLFHTSQQNDQLEGTYTEEIKQQDELHITKSAIEYWHEGELLDSVKISGDIIGSYYCFPVGFYNDSISLCGEYYHPTWEKLYFRTHTVEGKYITPCFIRKP